MGQNTVKKYFAKVIRDIDYESARASITKASRKIHLFKKTFQYFCSLFIFPEVSSPWRITGPINSRENVFVTTVPSCLHSQQVDYGEKTSVTFISLANARQEGGCGNGAMLSDTVERVCVCSTFLTFLYTPVLCIKRTHEHMVILYL